MRYTGSILALPALGYALSTDSWAEGGNEFKDGTTLSATRPSFEPGKVPVLGSSKTFQLYVHVMDKSRDKVPTLEGHIVVPSRIGRKYAAKADDKSYDAIRRSPHYLAGTQEDVSKGILQVANQDNWYQNGRLIELQLQYILYANPETFKQARFLSGERVNSPNITLSPFTDPISQLITQQYLSCDTYDRNNSVWNLDTIQDPKIPDKCTPIRIFPECIPDDKVEERFKPKVEAAPFMRCYQPGGDYSLFDKM